MSRKDPKRRPDGRYQRQVTIINEITGEKIVKTVYGYSTKELIAAADAIRRKYEPVVFTDLTLYEYLTEYIKMRKAELNGSKDGLTTLEGYEDCYDRYVKDTVLGNTQLMDLSVFLFKDFFANFKPKRKNAIGTRVKQTLYTVLKTALNEAKYEGLIEDNPLDRIRKPKHIAKKRQAVTQDQLNHILELAAVENQQNANLLHLDSQLGLRRGELTSLRFTDVDFTEKTLRVYRSRKRLHEGIYEGSTKNEYSRRVLKLDDISLAILRDQLRIAQATYKEAGQPMPMDSFVFFKDLGQPYGLDAASKIFATYRDALNYPKNITLHSLRHTAATVLAEHNITTKAMQVRFGWSTGKMADVYTHPTDKMQDEVVDVLNYDEKKASLSESLSNKKKA